MTQRGGVTGTGEMAVNAGQNKETPIKPIQNRMWNKSFFECGNCHCFVGKRDNYCANCGWKIGWDEVKSDGRK